MTTSVTYVTIELNLGDGMNCEQIKLLTKMKKLISENKRKVLIRKDRDYLEDLLEIGINLEDMWKEILSLNKNFYFPDPLPIYYQTENTLTFKKIINGYLTYIKLTIENKNNEKVVVISFHKDEGGI